MDSTDRVITLILRVWVCFVIFINLMFVVELMNAPSAYPDGVANVASAFSPDNVWLWMWEAIALTPAVALYFWRQRRRDEML